MQADELIARILAFADRAQVEEGHVPTPLAGLHVMRRFQPDALRSVLYQPTLCLVLQGAKQSFVGDRPVLFGRMQSVIISLAIPTVARVIEASREKPYVAMALELDIAMLRELAAELSGTLADEPAGSPIATDEADEAIIDAMARLFALADKPQAARVLEPLVRREIHYWLLTARHGAMLRALARADSHAARIARATAKIRLDYAGPLLVADLASIAGMSVSTFHEHFRAVTGTTPLQYQKQLRLLEARRLITAATHSVSSAAFAVGYESPTQFSREYSRQFGMAPRRDREVGVEALAP